MGVLCLTIQLFHLVTFSLIFSGKHRNRLCSPSHFWFQSKQDSRDKPQLLEADVGSSWPVGMGPEYWDAQADCAFSAGTAMPVSAQDALAQTPRMELGRSALHLPRGALQHGNPAGPGCTALGPGRVLRPSPSIGPAPSPGPPLSGRCFPMMLPPNSPSASTRCTPVMALGRLSCPCSCHLPESRDPSCFV